MKQDTILDDFLHLEKKESEDKYITDLTTGFHCQKSAKATYERSRTLDQNVILFVMEGSCSFSYNHYPNRVVFAGEMLFFPKSALVSGLILEDARFIYMTFDIPYSVKDKLFLVHLSENKKNVSYDFTPLKMNYPIWLFLHSLAFLLKYGKIHRELHDVKHIEIFLILRIFYTKEELARFFYPIIGQSFDFKNFVLENHHKCNQLSDLIKLSHMCPNAFMRKFKKEFGITGYQWMLKQTCQRIIHKASQPGVTLKDIMIETGIDSSSHLNRFCRKYFDITPGQLIAKCQDVEQANKRT